MRELVIAEVKRNIDYMNDYWKGWGDREENIRPYPNFDEMDDETLLETLVNEVGRTSQPRA